jgi:hypothetical protein
MKKKGKKGNPLNGMRIREKQAWLIINIADSFFVWRMPKFNLQFPVDL